jgi:DNA polymerase III epsilon subunit-like protein
LYVVFDLETTGRVRQRDEIIEVGASIYDQNGMPVEDAHFSQFVKPRARIPSFITQLTTITEDDDVAEAEPFPAVADAFIRFMQQHADENDGPISHIIMVGHNAKVFDIPFFVQKLFSNNMADSFFQDKRFGLAIDTLRLAKYATQQGTARSVGGVPTAYNLPTLFQFVTGQPPSISHRANSDVQATATILRFPIFWEKRKECVFRFYDGQGEETPRVSQQEDDSDTDSSSISSGELSSDNETDEDDEEPLGDRWLEGVAFEPPASQKPSDLFLQSVTTTARRSDRTLTGLLCSSIDVNTPMRAWRQVFTNYILDKIVGYTNEYGRLNAKRWNDISRKDLEAFIGILFISGIQKRKDKPANWFSDNRILENV